MAGVKGRSGRPRKPVAAHILQGTFRPDRHGPLPATVGATVPKPAPTPVPEALLAGLGPTGASLVRETFDAYDGWTPPKLLLLRKAGELTDATAGGPRGKDARLWLARHRALLATLKDLGLRD